MGQSHDVRSEQESYAIGTIARRYDREQEQYAIGTIARRTLKRVRLALVREECHEATSLDEAIDGRSRYRSSWNGLAAFGQAQGGRKIKVAQMGVGHAHATKLQVYRQSPDYEVVGIAEPNDDLRNRAKKLPAYEGLKWFSMEDILSMSEVEVVLVETRVRDLLSTAQRCIEANKHIHVDKPAGNSMPQWLHILKAAEERKRLVQMGTCTVTTPASC